MTGVICRKCSRVLPRSAFVKVKDHPRLFSPINLNCKECRLAWTRAYEKTDTCVRVRKACNEKNKERYYRNAALYRKQNRKDNPVFYRKKHLLTRYGMTLEEWETLFVSQGRRCSVCRGSEPTRKGWMVDHNHKTGRIRGILCAKCNSVLGLADDNLSTLQQAVTYLLEDYTFFQKPSLVTYPPQTYSLENTCPLAS